jgi:hypothetical protein
MAVSWKFVISPTKAHTNLRYWCLFYTICLFGSATIPDYSRGWGELTGIEWMAANIMRRLKSSLDPQTLEDVFAFLCQYNRQFGYSPTLREVAGACYMSRPNMYRYLDQLEAQGRISRDSGIARGITLIAPCEEQ